MNTRETKTKTKIKERMYAVIEYVECEESAQIAVNQKYFNKYADKLYNALGERAKYVSLIESWQNLLIAEVNRLKANSSSDSNIILKINNCAA